MAIPDQKVCSVCKVEKPAGAFRCRTTNGVLFLRSECKECTKIVVSRWKATNPGRAVEHQRVWKDRHREQHRAIDLRVQNRRRARLKGAPAEPYTAHQIYERDEGACGICNEPIDWALSKMDAQGYTIDHVTPISLGGADTIDNVRSAHRVCNLRRGARVEEMELANG